MPVEKDTLVRDILFFIKDDLGRNITDPIAVSRSSQSKFIMTSYPQRPVRYPIVTIKCTNIEAVRAGMQTTTQDISIFLEIRVWARDEKEKEKIYTDILNRLADIQFTTTTGSTANNLHDLLIGSSVEVDEPGEPGAKSIKSRILNIRYRFYNI